MHRRPNVDLAPHIARLLVEEWHMPCGEIYAATLAARLWPCATMDEVQRGYEIACEIYEDDLLFARA